MPICRFFALSVVTMESGLYHLRSGYRMDFAFYSVALVLAFSGARWFTENVKFHLRNQRFWVHHWILAAVAMLALVVLDVASPWVWGGLTGVALEGLRRDNWSLFR